jgi:hypothetical protein
MFRNQRAMAVPVRGFFLDPPDESNGALRVEPTCCLQKILLSTGTG